MNYVSGLFLCDFLTNLTTYYNDHRSKAESAKSFSYTPTDAIKSSCLTLGEMVAIRHFVWNTLVNLNRTGGKTRQLYIDSSTALGILDGGSSGDMTTAEYKTFLHDTIDAIVTTLKINCARGGTINVNTNAPVSNSTRYVIKNQTYTLTPSANTGWMNGSWSDTGNSGARSVTVSSPTELTYTFVPGANHFYYSDTANTSGGAYTSAGNAVTSNYGDSTWVSDSVDLSGNYLGETSGTVLAGLYLTVTNSVPIYATKVTVSGSTTTTTYAQGYGNITKAIINNLSSSNATIPNRAFAQCTKLTEIEIGTATPLTTSSTGSVLGEWTRPITTFGPYAFYNCTALTKITIGSGCLSGTTAIVWNDYLFSNDSNLVTIDIGCTVPPVASSSSPYWFARTPNDIIVPAANLYAYRTATHWSTYSSVIHGRYTYLPNTSSTVKYYTVLCTKDTTISVGSGTTLYTMALTANTSARFTGGTNGQVPNGYVFHSDYPLTLTEVSLTSYTLSANSSSLLTTWTNYLTVNNVAWSSATKSIYQGESVAIAISIPNYTSTISYTVGGTTSLEASSHTFTMSGNTSISLASLTRITRSLSVTAEHATITATQDGSALTLTKSGNTYTATVKQGASIVLSASNNTGYTVTSWSGDVTTNSFTVGAKDYNITANSTINKYTLKTASNNTSYGHAYIGTTGTTTESSNIEYNSQNTIRAEVVSSNYVFTGWSDLANSSALTTRIITMPASDTVYTANFLPNKYTLTVTSNDTNRGTVTGGGSYYYNSTATLQATALANYHFTKWSDNNTDKKRDVTVTGNASYQAIFDPDEFTITTSAGTGGTVSGGGSYKYLSSATLIATPSTGYSFSKWVRYSDNLIFTDQQLDITVTGAETYTAVFLANSYTITAVSTDTTAGTVSGGGSYTYGSSVILTATPTDSSIYRFSLWSDGNTDATRTITVSGNATYKAEFELMTYYISVGYDGEYNFDSDPVEIIINNDESKLFAEIINNEEGLVKLDVGSTVTVIGIDGEHQFKYFLIDDEKDSTNPLTLTIAKDIKIVAYYE